MISFKTGLFSYIAIVGVCRDALALRCPFYFIFYFSMQSKWFFLFFFTAGENIMYSADCLQKCGYCTNELCLQVNMTCLQGCKSGQLSSLRCDAGGIVVIFIGYWLNIMPYLFLRFISKCKTDCMRDVCLRLFTKGTSISRLFYKKYYDNHISISSESWFTRTITTFHLYFVSHHMKLRCFVVLEVRRQLQQYILQWN